MALDAGVMSITLEYAQGLRDKDWFGKQDPYCVMRVGGQTFRTRTATDGGRNPVWNQTFQANVINENDVEVVIKDEDLVSKDDVIGTATFSLARARQLGHDRVSAGVMCKRHRKQRGTLHVVLSWAPNHALAKPQPHACAHTASHGHQYQYAGSHTNIAPVPPSLYGGQSPYYAAPVSLPPAYGAPNPYASASAPPPPPAGYPAAYGYPPAGYAQPPRYPGYAM